tara:strand:+ start:23 stop:154 length:132 start_codon:yes stop_codon:yes gene_type:complete
VVALVLDQVDKDHLVEERVALDFQMVLQLDVIVQDQVLCQLQV